MASPPPLLPRYDSRDLETGKIIDTVSVQRASALIKPWVEHMEPFILVGPEGCGKSMLINHLVAQRKGTSVRTPVFPSVRACVGAALPCCRVKAPVCACVCLCWSFLRVPLSMYSRGSAIRFSLW